MALGGANGTICVSGAKLIALPTRMSLLWFFFYIVNVFKMKRVSTLLQSEVTMKEGLKMNIFKSFVWGAKFSTTCLH